MFVGWKRSFRKAEKEKESEVCVGVFRAGLFRSLLHVSKPVSRPHQQIDVVSRIFNYSRQL